jgi:MFS family permease
MRAETLVEVGRDRSTRAQVTGVALIVATVLPGFLTASLAPRIRGDFAFADATLGVTVAIFYVVSALSSTPCGRLVDRIGGVRGMRLAAGLVVVCSLSVALFAQSAPGLVALLVLGGVANGMGGPAVSALLKREVHERRQGLAFGVQQSGASIGSLLAGLALPLVAIPFGWRWGFAAAAVLAVVSVLPVPTGGAAPAEAVQAVRRGLSSVHAIAVAAALASAAGVGFVSFLVTYAVRSDIGEAEAGLLLGGVSLVATLSRIGLGAVFDRTGREPLALLAMMLALAAGAYLLLVAGEPPAIVAGALLAGGLGWSWPGGLTLAVVRRSPDAPAWAVGVMMSGLFAGAVAGPLLVGLLAEHGSFTAAWSVCAALALLAGGVLAATRRGERV